MSEKHMLSVRISKEIDNKICDLSKESGVSKTKIVTDLLSNGKIILIPQGKDIATGLFEMLKILNSKNCCQEELRDVVDSIFETLAAIHNKFLMEER